MYRNAEFFCQKSQFSAGILASKIGAELTGKDEFMGVSIRFRNALNGAGDRGPRRHVLTDYESLASIAQLALGAGQMGMAPASKSFWKASSISCMNAVASFSPSQTASTTHMRSNASAGI